MIEDHDDQHRAEHRLRHFCRSRPGRRVGGKEQHPEVEGKRGQRKLAQHGGRERDPLTAKTQPRLYLRLPDIDVLLKLTGQELARLRVEARDVGRESQDP